MKPLTSGQSDKKESRSVLEKLKSTIAPGWSAQQVTAEPQQIQVRPTQQQMLYSGEQLPVGFLFNRRRYADLVTPRTDPVLWPRLELSAFRKISLFF